MAKQIEDIILRLKQEGFEKLDKIKGSFRELNKVTGFTETDISKLRGRLNDFAKEAGNTEAVNKGLIEAFKGLRSQVDVNGKSYGELTSEITRMESVLRGSTAAIDKQRAVLLEHARAGTQNAKSLQQQIDGLERLRQQTRPGSAAFLQLSKDIDQARVNLGRFKSEASAAAATLTQIPAASLEKIAAQIGRLQGQMQKLNISSDEFLRYQQRIALIGTVRTRTEGRQQVRALNAMFESEQYAQFAEGRAANLELPDTLAGIRLRISEINAELENITGYERRRALTVELKDLNRQLKNAIVDVVTQEDLALQRLRARVNAQREVNQASGFRAFSQQVGAGEFDPAITKSVRRGRQRLEEENERLRKAANEAFNLSNTPLLLPAAGQTSAAGTGDVISGGARRLVPGRTETTLGAPGERGAAQQGPLPSVAVGVQPAVAGRLAEQFDNLGKSVDRARRPLRDIYVDIDKTTRASNGSVNSLEAQIGAWTELRNAVGRTAPAFGTASKKLEQLTAQRERITGGRRLSGMQLAQGVGAALSGGIFGGPEGLIGGLGGLALGGVGGAFAGAAAGAQVGMFRQQLGTVTDYSARIDKLQIALRGIVGSQDAYSQALAAAASVTRDLNIPQEVAIQGMTRLSAAVKGAGGTVSDSAFAFRAVSEAVKATGGNAEQADGALLALTQVFSKGKVSAEELNQIAERLPGTFTLFAKAAGMTGPQLQKALQEGQVGLNDLMKFLQLISTEYGQTALKIADSSQEAGARLSVAMKNMQLEVGRALQPIGASLQSAFADFITKITPSVVSAMKGIAAAFEFLIENKTASGLATFALQLGAVTAGLIALRSAMATLAAVNLAAMFTTTAASAKITGDVLTTAAASAGGLAGKLGAVRTSLGLLAGAAAKPIVITVILAGVTEAILRIREVYKFFGESQRVSKELSGSAWLKNMGGTALNRTQLSNLATQTTNAYNFNRAEVARLTQERKTLESQIALADDNVAASGLRNKLAGVNTGIQTAQTRIKNTKANLDAIYDALNRPKVDAAAGLSTFPTPATDEEKKKKSAADKAARDAQAAAAEQQRLANTLLDQQLNAADRLFQHQIELDRQRYELQKRLDDAQAQNRILRETGAARDIVSNFEDLQRSLREIEERRVRAVQDVRLAKQTQQTATVRAAFADQGAAALSAGGTGISATAIAKATAEAAKFTGIANQCSEAVKSFYKSLGITLPGVTAWADTVRNAGTVMRDWSKLRPGDIVATGRPGDTPHVGVYTGGNNVFHQSRKRGLTAGNYPDLDYFKSGYFVRPTQSAGTARMPTGAAAQQNRAIRASGGAVIEGLDVNKAEAQLQLIEANVSKERATLFEQFTLKATDALRQQNATMRDSNELQTLRNRLTLEGVRPEFVDLEERLLGIRQEQNQAQTTYNQLVKANPDRAAELQSVLAAQNEQYAERARLLRENAEAAEAFNKAMRTRQDERIGLGLREGAEAYVQSIGTMREATAQLAQTGIKGVEDAIFSLVTTGTANFREFAASILRDTARMIIQQMVLRSIMQIIGAVAPGGSPASALVPGMPFNPASIPGMAFAYGGIFAKNNVVPFAMGGTFPRNVTAYAMGGIVDTPTLFPFANGGAGRLGLMGEAGPEAIMPLRRLPSGRLGVEAGGAGTGVVVNVNVDAKGTAVESDQSNGQALGAVVGAAVRAEIVQQQRPGGLLDSSRRR
jgi:lambda family phage tail tape measure protein